MRKRLVLREGFGLPKISLLLIVVLIFFLSSCSSGGGDGASNGGVSQDADLYQQALSDYQAGNYSQARDEFQNLIAGYPNSIYVDNSQYYTARCYHELHDFTTARTRYDAFIAAYPASNYVDNAVFYHGKSYLDEAGLQTVVQTEFDLLQAAIAELQVFITNNPASSLLDAGRYYLGHGYHDEAVLVTNDAALSTDSAAQLFDLARSSYDSVIADTASVYADNAQYYKAQTFHDEARYVEARAAYSVLINAGVSTWADDAKYQYAKTYYDEAVAIVDPAAAPAAIALFNTAIAEFDLMLSGQAYQTSNRLDSAYYFKGRSYQRQGNLIASDANLGDLATTYGNARIVFQQLVDTMPTSTWADNALYQIGATYYDEAAVAASNGDYIAMRELISSAVAKFNALLNDALYQTLNSADNAQYYLGRSYQMIMTMPANERSGTVGGLDFASVTYDTARNAFSMLMQNFPQSSWIDNAYYEIGNTYYAEAESAIDNLVKAAAFNNALDSYFNVVSNYTGSIRFDNAVFQIGWIYHLGEYCLQEMQWFTYHETLTNVSASDAAIRDSHLTDLALTVPASHICPPTPTLSLTIYNASQTTP